MKWHLDASFDADEIEVDAITDALFALLPADATTSVEPASEDA